VDPNQLFDSPNPLAAHYARFRVEERILLTGHSHQAWPDRARDAQLAAWDDAAQLVDDKWERAFAVGDRVRDGFSRLMGDPDGLYALGANTHELLVRLFSALPLAERPRVVTTDSEFHSARRQLRRLEEAGLEVVRVPADPAPTVGERLAAFVDDRTAAVLTSTVFFRNARIAGGLEALGEACRLHGAALILDVYHQLNAVPFSLRERDLEDAFAVGGGYKYCQLGEGNCFLRFPPDCDLRPVVTGWFAEFDELADPASTAVAYSRGASRFAGSTYDPTSHYRAAAVFDFFAEQALTPATLRALSQRQVGRLVAQFDALDLSEAVLRRDRNVPLAEIGGFLCLRSSRAEELSRRLRDADVFTDVRGDVLRLGPAPYLSPRQLDDAIAALAEAAGLLAGEQRSANTIRV